MAISATFDEVLADRGSGATEPVPPLVQQLRILGPYAPATRALSPSIKVPERSSLAIERKSFTVSCALDPLRAVPNLTAKRQKRDTNRTHIAHARSG